MLNHGRACGLAALAMFLMLLSLFSLTSYADSTDYDHHVAVSSKSLTLNQDKIRYFGLDVLLFRFGFIGFDLAAVASGEDLQQKAWQQPNGPIIMQGYFGVKPVFMFALGRASLSLSYLFGGGIGYRVQASGDVIGECNCSYNVKEAAVALSVNLSQQWEIGVEKSQLTIESSNALDDKWNGESIFLRYAW